MSRGYTLLEVIVVLVLLTLAASVVAPVFVAPRDPAAAAVGVIGRARALAIRRAEALELRIEPSGAWRLDGVASAQAGALVTGTISPAPRVAITLLFSPLGSCAPDAVTTVAPLMRLDPLTCEAAR
jgi:prepilin-type N-terminal cleavage/methylation domain-containing protein